MKKRLFPLLIALSALSVAGSAAFYSVFGLSKLFAGAATQVIIMAGSLEFAKLVTASLLYQYWRTINKFLNTSLIFGGSIMDDTQVLASVHAQQPVVIRYPKARAVINMQLICRRILKLPVRQSIQKDGNYFDRVRERLNNLDLEGKSA